VKLEVSEDDETR
jgi:predicted ATP-binding protein involved in virulence